MFYIICYKYINEINFDLFISKKFILELQAPLLEYLNVTGDRIRLGIKLPTGSFDYVFVYCPDGQSHLIFNTSISFNKSRITVDCSFLLNVPLMNFVLKTVKKNFTSAVNNISQEGRL